MGLYQSMRSTHCRLADADFPDDARCSGRNSISGSTPLGCLHHMNARATGPAQGGFKMTTFSNTFAFAVMAATLAGVALFNSSAASAASGAKEVFIQDYKFDKPMHGYSGHSGNYFCDYQRLPERKCFLNANGTETCKIVGWTLREMCQ
jgi:hypothetical protein